MKIDDKKFLLGHELYENDPKNVRVENRRPIYYYLDDLLKSMVVLGNSGSGKTNTIMEILDQLDHFGIPFWVFDCKKREYRKKLLPDFRPENGILHFTPETEDLNPFRYSPFEVTPSVRVQTHIQNRVAVFNYAYDLQEPLPELIEDAFFLLYKERGWDVTMNERPPGNDVFPRISDLPDAIEQVFERRDKKHQYAGEPRANMVSALITRVRDLLHAGRGRMYDCDRGIPIDLLYRSNVIFELDQMGEADERRRFFLGSLMTTLTEYLSMRGQQPGLRHVTVIEEAHRVLGSTRTVMGEQTNNAVTNLISEGRSLGEGMIIADQHPERIPVHVIGLAQSGIVHRLQSANASNVVCDSFNCRRGFTDFSKLKIGECFLFSPRDETTRRRAGVTYNPCSDLVSDVPEDEVMNPMKVLYEQFPEVKQLGKVDEYNKLMMGIPPFKFDRMCAISEFRTLVQDRSFNNPFNLQNRRYYRQHCMKEFNESKFFEEGTKRLINSIEKDLLPLDWNDPAMLPETFERIMHLTISGIDVRPIPLPAVLLSLRLLMLHLNFSDKPWESRARIHRKLLHLLKEYSYNQALFGRASEV